MFHGQWVSNIVQFSQTLLSIYRHINLCVYVHTQLYGYGKGIPKSRAVIPSCSLWVHTTTSKERTYDNILISKPLPGEGTHERKSNRGTYLQAARRDYHGKQKGYNGRRGISQQRQCGKWEKRTTVSISQLGENYLGRLRRASWVMGLSGLCGWKQGLRSRTLLSIHHALFLTLADLTRGELLRHGYHVLLHFFRVQTQRRKTAIEDFGNIGIVPKSWGYQCHLQWIHAPRQGESVWTVCEFTSCHVSHLLW